MTDDAEETMPIEEYDEELLDSQGETNGGIDDIKIT